MCDYPTKVSLLVVQFSGSRSVNMPKKTYTPEQIINKLREAEILLSQGAILPVLLKRSESAIAPITAGARSMAACGWNKLSGSRSLR